MEFIRKHSRLLFVMVMPVYFYIVQSSIQNKHTHFCPNGMVITHSHPLEKNSDNPVNHDHSKTEILFFSSLSFDFYELPPAVGVEGDLNEIHHTFFIGNDDFVPADCLHYLIPRAPPVC